MTWARHASQNSKPILIDAVYTTTSNTSEVYQILPVLIRTHIFPVLAKKKYTKYSEVYQILPVLIRTHIFPVLPVLIRTHIFPVLQQYTKY
jgi:hypothetical protein